MADRQAGIIGTLDLPWAKSDISIMPIEHTIPGQTLASPASPRFLPQALWRGFCLRCPNCGIGRLFSAYLKVNDRCPRCQEELHHQRADDAPPYFVILIVGHLVVGAALTVEVALAPPMWVQMAIWPLLAVALCLLMLPRIKGALIGLQWALRMHGFDPAHRSRSRAPGDGRRI